MVSGVNHNLSIVLWPESSRRQLGKTRCLLASIQSMDVYRRLTLDAPLIARQKALQRLWIWQPYQGGDVKGTADFMAPCIVGRLFATSR
jgi:hypothetical protein